MHYEYTDWVFGYASSTRLLPGTEGANPAAPTERTAGQGGFFVSALSRLPRSRPGRNHRTSLQYALRTFNSRNSHYVQSAGLPGKISLPEKKRPLNAILSAFEHLPKAFTS